MYQEQPGQQPEGMWLSKLEAELMSERAIRQMTRDAHILHERAQRCTHLTKTGRWVMHSKRAPLV